MNVLEKGTYYSIQEINESGLVFVTKTTTLLFYKYETHLYIFHIVAKIFKGVAKHQLLSVQLDDE
jgi:hypothetical protein